MKWHSLGMLAMGAMLAFGSAMACDDDGGSDASGDAAVNNGTGGNGNTTPVQPIMTGIAPDKMLGMLTPQEATELCESTEMFLMEAFNGEEFRRGTCKLAAVLGSSFSPDGDPEAACQLAFDACLNAPPVDAGAFEAPDGGVGDGCANPEPFSPQCQGTVEQYEMCINALPDGIGSLDELLPDCDQVGSDAGAFNPLLFALLIPQSCIQLQTQCPDFETPGLSDMQP